MLHCKWMKFVAVLAAFMLLLSVGVYAAEAQDVQPEENLLVLACNQVMVEATKEQIEIVNCRQAAPIQIDGNNAIVHISVRTSTAKYKFVAFYQRTLWSNQGWFAEP